MRFKESSVLFETILVPGDDEASDEILFRHLASPEKPLNSVFEQETFTE